MVSRVRQNFSEEAEALINKQINLEFHASYVHLAMGSWFSRDDQALHGFAKYFTKSSQEEREHGMKLMEYQTKRGGKVVFQDITKPSTMEWGSPLQAMEATLELEKSVNQSLLSLHAVAGEKNDPHLCDFLEEHYLAEQVEAIKEVSDMVTKLRRFGESHVGVHILDKELESKE
uniref:Ferritin n=1 Tax=Acartia pacifica TaxID=335913 RepID=R9TDZ6_ACAPC|nr:ferritin heavy subunit [Acartia pacifica]